MLVARRKIDARNGRYARSFWLALPLRHHHHQRLVHEFRYPHSRRLVRWWGRTATVRSRRGAGVTTLGYGMPAAPYVLPARSLKTALSVVAASSGRQANRTERGSSGRPAVVTPIRRRHFAHSITYMPQRRAGLGRVT